MKIIMSGVGVKTYTSNKSPSIVCGHVTRLDLTDTQLGKDLVISHENEGFSSAVRSRCYET